MGPVHSRLQTTLAGAFLVLLCCVSAPAAAAPTKSGVAIRTSPGADPELFTVRLGFEAGLATEGPGSWGRAAALASWLRRGPSPNLAAGELEDSAQRAGLRVETQLEHHTVSLTLTGPVSALERALWLVTERLRPQPVEADEDMAAGIRDGIWAGAEHTRSTAIGPWGDAVDILAHRVRGDGAGHTAFASRLQAQRAEDELLVDLAIAAANDSPAGVVVVAPERLVARARAILERDLSGLPARPAPEARSFPPSSRERPRAREPMELDNPLDQRGWVVAAWDLRGAAAGAELDPVERDATLLALRTWLGHEGGALHRRLVEEFAVARQVEVQLRDDGIPTLLVSAEVRAGQASEAARLLVEEVERLGSAEPPPDDLRGAARAAAVDLGSQWAWPPARARLIETLVASGRVARDGDPDAWFGRLLDALRSLPPDAAVRLASRGLREDRRTLARVEPSSPPPEEEVVLDGDVLDTYLRVMVDLRCPPPGSPDDVVRVLEEKYDLAPRAYVILTRAIARRPDVMRGLARKADDRCREYEKLRALMPRERALDLHEAVACEAGGVVDDDRREAVLRDIWRRFDVDPSWYRPLARMLREDITVRERVRAIDERCEPRHGPAARPLEGA